MSSPRASGRSTGSDRPRTGSRSTCWERNAMTGSTTARCRTGPAGHDERLSQRALNRALLARQCLLERQPLSPLAAVERLVGLQAQNPPSPYLALWSRLAAFEPEGLSRLLVERQVVRIALMRSTIHVVAARDCLELRPLIQPVLDRQLAGARSLS